MCMGSLNLPKPGILKIKKPLLFQAVEKAKKPVLHQAYDQAKKKED